MNKKLSKIRNWIWLKNPDWATLEKIQKVRIVQSTYVWIFIVPVLAKALSRIEDPIKMMVFYQKFELHTSLPFSWWVFYFAAISFVLANLIFIWKCPKIVKDHNDFGDFLAKKKGEAHLYYYATQLDNQYNDFIHFLSENRLVNQFEEHERTQFDYEVKMSDAFWGIHDVHNVIRRFWRLFCTSLYAVGFILIFIVLVQNLWAVLQLIF